MGCDKYKEADFEFHVRLVKLEAPLICSRGHVKEVVEYMGLKL